VRAPSLDRPLADTLAKLPPEARFLPQQGQTPDTPRRCRAAAVGGALAGTWLLSETNEIGDILDLPAVGASLALADGYAQVDASLRRRQPTALRGRPIFREPPERFCVNSMPTRSADLDHRLKPPSLRMASQSSGWLAAGQPRRASLSPGVILGPSSKLASHCTPPPNKRSKPSSRLSALFQRN